MRAEMGLPSVKGDDEHGGGMTGGFGGSMGGARGGKSKRPITVKFEIPYFTTSGIQVRYLKIIEPKVSGHFHYACPRMVIGMSVACINDRNVRLNLVRSFAEPCMRNLIKKRCGSAHAGEGRVLRGSVKSDRLRCAGLDGVVWRVRMTNTYPCTTPNRT